MREPSTVADGVVQPWSHARGYRVSVVLEPDGTIRHMTEVSAVGAPLTEALIGRNLLEISSAIGSGLESVERWRARLATAAEGVMATRYRDAPPGAPAGAVPSIECVVTPVRSGSGELQAILLEAVDLTERLDWQRLVAESESRFRSLAEFLPQMVWIADPDGEVTYFSPRWSAFTGRTPAELVGRGYRDLIHPDDLASLAAGQRDRGETAYSVEFRLLRRDGHYRTMEAAVQLIRDDDGELVRVVGGTIDITDRRAAEQSAREHQEQLRVALAMTGLGRYTLTLRDPRLSGDDRFWELMGIDPPAPSESGDVDQYFDMLHPADMPRVREAFERAVAGGPDYDVEYRFNRPTADGFEERRVAVVGRVDFDADGPVRMVGVIGDITDRHREEEIRLLMQKREAIGTLAGGIAHDFNNVIGAILSNAAIARTEIEVGESPATSLQEIERGGARAAAMVRRMLSYVREDEPCREPLDLGDVVREACALVRPTLPQGVRLVTDLGGDLPTIAGDATQLHQLAMNLVANAGQAIGAGTGTVSVSVETRTVGAGHPADGAFAAGVYLALIVRDDGSGMSEAVQKRVFDPFFTTKPAGEGTGLGLAAAQTIARAHGGLIFVQSSPDVGTTFTVKLPVAGTDDPPAPSPAARFDVTEGTTIRMLFVDDEPALARLAERALPLRGCEAEAFTDPEQALAAFIAAPHRFDAVVTDLSMPGMTGLELAAQVRKVRAGIPVVLTSGYLTATQRAAAEQHAIDAIIPKPCSINDLATAVLNLVERTELPST